MHISSADKKEKPWFLKALKTRRNPFFDKTVRKTGFIHFGSTIKFEVRNLNPWLAIVILKESAVKRGRDDFFLHSTMQARKLNSSGDAAVTTAVYLCSSLFCYIGCISVHLLSYYNHVQNQKQTSGENNPLDQYILVLAQTGRQ